MNIRNLKYLIEIERSGSLSAAAQKLYISQSYLSRVVHDTEQEYHLTVFTRDRRGLTLTEGGRVFLEMAKELVNQADEFENTFRQNRPVSTLRIVSSPSSYSVAAFTQMLREMPEQALRYSYKEKNAAGVIDAVYNHRADLGVIYLKDIHAPGNAEFFKGRHIEYKKAFSTSLHILLRRGHPLFDKPGFTLEDLYEYNMVVLQNSSGVALNGIADGFYNSYSLPDLVDFDRFRQVVRITDRSILHDVLRDTDYIALGNQLSGQPMPALGIRILPFPFPAAVQDMGQFNHSLYYIYLKDRPLPPAAQTYIRYLCSLNGENKEL